MKVNWDDIGRSESPGEYPVHEQIVLVQKSDITEWKHHPNAVFETVDARFKDGGMGHLLDDCGDSAGGEA